LKRDIETLEIPYLKLQKQYHLMSTNLAKKTNTLKTIVKAKNSPIIIREID